MSKLKFGERTINLPRSRLARIAVGIGLVLGGFLGFLPIVGFWMIPLGLLVLSIDIPTVRRLRRQWTVKFGNWMVRRYPTLARRFGFNGNGSKPVRPRKLP